MYTIVPGNSIGFWLSNIINYLRNNCSPIYHIKHVDVCKQLIVCVYIFRITFGQLWNKIYYNFLNSYLFLAKIDTRNYKNRMQVYGDHIHK